MNFLKKAAANIVAQVGEAVAPLIRSNVETLQWNWKKVDEEYGRLLQAANATGGGMGLGVDDPQLLVDSKLTDYLNAMVEAVVKEEEDDTVEGTGPCFEYLLQQNVIDKLCALGLPDRPPGMRTLIVRVLDAFLSNVRHPLLPNMSVHLAVRQFIDVCFRKGDLHAPGAAAPAPAPVPAKGGAAAAGKAAEASAKDAAAAAAKEASGKEGNGSDKAVSGVVKPRSSLIRLLRTIAAHFRRDNNLAGIFFEERAADPANGKPARAEFIIFSALLTQLNVEPVDSDTRHALEGLLALCQLPNRKITNFIVHHTDFCRQVVAGLKDAFVRIPKVLEVDSVLSVTEPFETLHASFPPFIARLELMERIANTTYRDIGDALGHALLHDFLIPVVQPCLCHVQERIAKFTSWYVTKLLLGRWTNPSLLRAVVHFLIGEISPLQPELRAVPSALTDEQKQHTVRTTLIKRIDSLSEELSVSALALFDALLQLRNQEVMYNLLIRNLLPLRHIAPAHVRAHASQHVMVDPDLAPPLPPSDDDAAAGNGTSGSAPPTPGSPMSPTPTTAAPLPALPHASPVRRGVIAPAPANIPLTPATARWSDLRPVGRSVIYHRAFQNLNFKYNEQFEEYLMDAQQQGQLWWTAWDQWRADPMYKAACAHFVALHITGANTGAAAPTNATAPAAAAPAPAPAPVTTAAAVGNSDDILPAAFLGTAAKPPAPAPAPIPAASNDALAAFFSGAPAPAAAPATAPQVPAAAPAATAAVAAPTGPATFYEGLFCHTLFSKISVGSQSGVFKHSVAHNLLLTSVLSRMFGCPHPLVHSYGFDPLLPFVGGNANATNATASAAAPKPAPTASAPTTPSPAGFMPAGFDFSGGAGTGAAAARASPAPAAKDKGDLDPFAVLTQPAAAAPASPAPVVAAAPAVTGPRTLLGVLNDAWNRGLQRRAEMKNAAQRLDEAKQRMGAVKAAAAKSPESLDDERYLCAVIVLEETIKEVMATAEVASHISGCQTLARITVVPGAAGAAGPTVAQVAAAAGLTSPPPATRTAGTGTSAPAAAERPIPIALPAPAAIPPPPKDKASGLTPFVLFN